VDRPLVVASDRAHTLPHWDVVRGGNRLRVPRFVLLPDFERSVRPRAGKSVPIFIKVERPDGGLVALQHGAAFPVIARLTVQPDGVVIAAGGKELRGRVPLHAFHILSVGGQNAGTFKLFICSLCLLTFPYPDTFISGTRGQQVSCAGPSNTLDFIFMTLQSGQAFKFPRLPAPYRRCRVKAGCSQILTTG
ncbi:hypothetical protein EGW08_004950, partial [Elysia chlorotica]